MRRPAPLDLVAGIAIAACAVVAIIATRHVAVAAQAWLAAYLFWAGLPVGALFLVLVHGLTGGAWGLTLRPALAAMLRMLPFLALFLIPALFGATRIYAEVAAGHGRMALPFFVARAILYVVLWNAIGIAVMRRMLPDGSLPPSFAWPSLILLFPAAASPHLTGS